MGGKVEFSPSLRERLGALGLAGLPGAWCCPAPRGRARSAKTCVRAASTPGETGPGNYQGGLEASGARATPARLLSSCPPDLWACWLRLPVRYFLPSLRRNGKFRAHQKTAAGRPGCLARPRRHCGEPRRALLLQFAEFRPARDLLRFALLAAARARPLLSLRAGRRRPPASGHGNIAHGEHGHRSPGL